MRQVRLTFMPSNKTVLAEEGTTLLQAQIAAGLHPDAPCGGRGTCGKCKVRVNGEVVLACQTPVQQGMTVWTEEEGTAVILTEGITAIGQPDGRDRYAVAFDVGTTTVVAYLLDGVSGKMLAQSSCMNPQSQYGADVISRIQYAMQGGMECISTCIQDAMKELFSQVCRKAGVPEEDVTAASVVGNTAMHHLLMKIDPKTLVIPPYMPSVSEAIVKNTARILPNIAGFVGGDTVGCMVSTRFDRLEELTLLIDIGTNGEMVLGNKDRMLACSTAAGPAFEGAKISCGMRGAKGAVDHVLLENGEVHYHVIGDTQPVGLCGSGLLDLVSVLLDLEVISDSGRMEQKEYALCENVILTQKDVREVQLAKAAIRAGIELMAQQLGVAVGDIRKVYLAGAFGNYLDPVSACRIGMIPPVLLERIVPIGNAAGEGAKLCALSLDEFDYSKTLARKTEFLELASLPQFQDQYVDALEFSEEEE